MRLTVLVAIISMTATGSITAIARPPKPQTHRLIPTRRLKPTLPLRQMRQLKPTLPLRQMRQPIQIAKILQLHQQKLWPLEMRDVSLDLKAGLPPNSVECTCLKPVMTRRGELPTRLAAPSSAEPVEPRIRTRQNQNMMPQMLL